jgi:23S rRNA pseudouridine1911/1915/1917 synthase
VRVNNVTQKPSYILRGTEDVAIDPVAPPPLHAQPEDLPLEILYEDDSVLAVNKPAGMVVHSGAGRPSGTLVNALLHRFRGLSTLGGAQRPGIVHRLDRLTSGVILVARTDAAHGHLAEQFASRRVGKVYLALVHGRIKADWGRIATPITRDPVRRVRMTAKLARGRAALTEYKVIRRFEKFTLLEVRIGTGRTHQIRVHLASIGHPVVGDRLYGAPASTLARYFLHAQRITFTSPASGERVTVQAPLPPELQDYLDNR